MMSAECADAEAAAARTLNRGMSALEIEPPEEIFYPEEEKKEEMASLVRETLADGGGGGAAGFGSTVRKRTAARGAGNAFSSALILPFAALIERNRNFSSRKLLVLAGLGGAVFLWVRTVGGAVDSIERGMGTDDGGDFHRSSFGGIKNVAQPAGARAYAAGGKYEEIFIPVSNVGHAVQSLSLENVRNHYGHYVHDEHRSPYASHLYRKNRTVLEAEQEKYVEKMARVRAEWGAWDFFDDYEDKHGEKRPTVDFNASSHRDAPVASFPKDSWQNDELYVRNLLSEAKALVSRVREGIYAEYGFPTNKTDGTRLTEEERDERDALFGVAHDAGADRKRGVGWLNPNAWDGLIRKLLHAMMTNDAFFVVLGGHSSAAGHGNNFPQTKIMAFHYLMEPVFDKLGMRLISRNMAQGGVGTMPSAFGGADIYGEKDILLWDSAMTEKNAGSHDMFNKQAILSGERAPVILSAPPVNIMNESNGTAWIGGINSNTDLVKYTTRDKNQAKTVPWAVRFMQCEREQQDLCKENKYNSICWEPRRNVTPSVTQANYPGGQAGWHPGFRSHQLDARKLSLLVLHALDAALGRWEDAIEKDFPLPEEFWHVGDVYQKMREQLRTHVNSKPTTVREGEPDVQSACEKEFHIYPRICRVAMHSFGEWTPRVNPEHSSLRSIIKPAADEYIPHLTAEAEYEGIDVLPYNQRLPDGEIDVHAIAIATTAEPPELDHSYEDEDDRKLLVESTRRAVRRSSQRKRGPRRVRLEEKYRQHTAPPSKEANANGGERNPAFRSLAQDEVVPGRGWSWYEQYAGFCDGSSMSMCNRNKGNNCLLYGHNDGRAGILGDALSGWLVVTVPKVKEGIILFRMEWWVNVNSNERTKGWTGIDNIPGNNGTQQGEGDANVTRSLMSIEAESSRRAREGGDRRLSGAMPDDMEFDIAINGEIKKTMKKNEFMSWGKEIVKNFALWPVLDDVAWAKGELNGTEVDEEDVEVGIRLRSAKGREATLKVSHVYYA